MGPEEEKGVSTEHLKIGREEKKRRVEGGDVGGEASASRALIFTNLERRMGSLPK